MQVDDRADAYTSPCDISLGVDSVSRDSFNRYMLRIFVVNANARFSMQNTPNANKCVRRPPCTANLAMHMRSVLECYCDSVSQTTLKYAMQLSID